MFSLVNLIGFHRARGLLLSGCLGPRRVYPADAMLIEMKTLTKKYGVNPRGVVHVGAHLAEEREAYEQAGATAVVWVEANPAMVPRLVEQARGTMDTRVVQALLTDRDGDELPFHVASNGQSSSMLEPALHHKMHPRVSFPERMTLQTTTFQTLAAREQLELARYDFLNLDVQGAELLVLKGFGALLDGFDAIYTEVNVGELYRGCARLEELDAYLGGRGFRRAATKLTKYKWGDALYLRRA